MSEKKLHESKSYRQMKIGEFVEVSQSVSLFDFVWEEARVNWSSFGGVNWREANEFSNDLKEAIAIAKTWTNERAGKPESE